MSAKTAIFIAKFRFVEIRITLHTLISLYLVNGIKSNPWPLADHPGTPLYTQEFLCFPQGARPLSDADRLDSVPQFLHYNWAVRRDVKQTDSDV